MTTTPPLLDVLMCTYDSAHVLPQVLGALEALARVVDLRVIVCDNASSDNTLDVLHEHAARLPLTLINSANNVGFAVAVNRCLALRRPKAVTLVLNPDVVLGPPNDMLALLEGLAGEAVGAVTPLLLTSDGSVDHACARPEPTPFKTLVYLFKLTRLAAWLAPRQHWYGRVPSGPSSIDSCSGAFMLLRPEALDDVGTFDEQFWMYAEDLDLCRRLRVASWQIRFDPRVRALHLKGASTSGAWSGPTHYWFFESMRRYYAKWYSSSLLGRVGIAPVSAISRLWSRAVTRHDVKSTQLWR